MLCGAGFSSPASPSATFVLAYARVQQQLQAQADAAGTVDWRARADSTVVRGHHHAAGARKGGLSSQESRAAEGIGRSRGGLTTTLHLLADGHGRALVTRITPGQAADIKELVALLDAVAVPRPGALSVKIW